MVWQNRQKETFRWFGHIKRKTSEVFVKKVRILGGEEGKL